MANGELQRANNVGRRAFLQSGAAATVVAASGMGAGCRPQLRQAPRTIVLGIDGMDPVLLRQFIAAGRMPHMSRFVSRYGLHELGTTNPAQSPVAWASFISGSNPGVHGIFDFITRDDGSVLPSLSTSRLHGESRTLSLGKIRLPLQSPKMENLRRGPCFWSVYEEAGEPSTILRVPDNFPPTGGGHRMISGLGTPDVHGSSGVFTLFTDRHGERSRDVSGGRIERVHVRGGIVEGEVEGPRNTMRAGSPGMGVPFRARVDARAHAVRLTLGGHELLLREGEWSGWLPLRFIYIKGLAGSSGMVRVLLKSASAPFELYVSPVNIDPMDPALPIDESPGYAARQARRTGRFYTQGMPYDTSALVAGALSDDEYRSHVDVVLREEEEMFFDTLERHRDGLYFYYFSVLDLNSHVLWRMRDHQHPAYSEAAATRHGDLLGSLYERMDAAVGRAISVCRPQDTLLICSDHGFTTFRRHFNLNSWLRNEGYLALEASVKGKPIEYFEGADWTGTKAYGLGLTGLYLNRAGREPHGTVAARDIDTVAASLVERLMAYRDPLTGGRVIASVKRREELYRGDYVALAPDLVVEYAPPYRASWSTVLGGVTDDVVGDNCAAWSGDHVVAADAVPGVLLTNLPVHGGGVRLPDVVPSLLARRGMKVPSAMTGRRDVFGG